MNYLTEKDLKFIEEMTKHTVKSSDVDLVFSKIDAAIAATNPKFEHDPIIIVDSLGVRYNGK